MDKNRIKNIKSIMSSVDKLEIENEQFEARRMFFRLYSHCDVNYLISTVEEQQKEIERLNESLKYEAVISTIAGQDIYTLEKEVERLKVIEQAYEALKSAL